MLAILIELMQSRNSDIYSLALRLVSECFAQNTSENLVEHGLRCQVLERFQDLLSSTEQVTVREALWGLSNVTASNQNHVKAFFDDISLFERVISLASHSN